MSTAPSAASPGAGTKTVDRSPAERVLVDSVRDGRCILFLGAGVHFPPPDGSPFTYPEEERPPLGRALAVQLAADCNFAKVVPDELPTLQRVSLCYEKELGRLNLVEQIRTAEG